MVFFCCEVPSDFDRDFYVVLDATGKIAPAILRGNQDDMGYYDECVNINEEVDGDTIKGRYCYFGLFIPWECIVSDGGCNSTGLSIRSIDKKMVKRSNLNKTIYLKPQTDLHKNALFFICV